MSDSENLDQLPRLYRDLADWWPLVSSPDEYAEAAEFYRQAILSASAVAPKTLLELDCGGGNNASFLKEHFEITLVDLAPEMLEVSRQRNPECEHLRGDMRSLRLGRQFDAVFIEDAIAYMTSEHDLRCALRTAYQHCKPGGVALFAPDHTRETFQPSTTHGGQDREDWLRLIAEVGFQPKAVPFEHRESEPGPQEVFLGLKPPESDKRPDTKLLHAADRTP